MARIELYLLTWKCEVWAVIHHEDSLVTRGVQSHDVTGHSDVLSLKLWPLIGGEKSRDLNAGL